MSMRTAASSRALLRVSSALLAMMPPRMSMSPSSLARRGEAGSMLSTRRRMRVRGVRRSWATAARMRSCWPTPARMRSCILLKARAASRTSVGPSSGRGAV